MRILTLTSLFPNSQNPAHGIFVYRRVSATAQLPDVEGEVIAPVPFAPRWLSRGTRRAFSSVPASESLSGLRVYHPRYPLVPKISMPLHGFLMYLGVRKLARRLHQRKPFDCIDAHYVYPDGFAAVLLGKSLGIPVVVSARGTDLNLFPSFPTIRWMIRWTLRKSSAVIAVSSELKQRALELGSPVEKVRMIGNGVDPDLFHVIDRSEARKRLGIAEDAKVLVSVASLRPGKGHDLVISALGQIVHCYPEVRLYLIGEGNSRKGIQELIRKKSLEERVILVGNKRNEELSLWFNAANASVLASASEGWPNVVLESLACGTPVIASRVGQIPELLSSPGLGLLVERNPESLALAMQSALAMDWNRSGLESFAHLRPWSRVALEVRDCLTSAASPPSLGTRLPVLAP